MQFPEAFRAAVMAGMIPLHRMSFCREWTPWAECLMIFNLQQLLMGESSLGK